VWRYERRGEHWTKVPYRPDGGGRAKVTDPPHAAPFDVAWGAYRQGGWDGIGFVLREGDGLVVVDLDDCLTDDGTLPPAVAALVQRAGTFTERSPGGQGLHLIGRLADHARELLPTGRRGTVAGLGKVEIYRTERYMAVTGLRWPATPAELADLSPVVAELVAALDAPRQQRAQPAAPPPPPASPPPVASDPQGNPSGGLSDAEVLALLRRYRHSEDFEALWRGQWQGRYPSQSEADLALANLLAWACGPHGRAQAERLWRQSGLAQRAKAQREDYVARTFDRAYERGDFYEAYPLDLEALRRSNAARQAATPAAPVPPTPLTPPPPPPLAPAAFYGLAGEIAAALAAGVVADPPLPARAVLVHVLAALGALATALDAPRRLVGGARYNTLWLLVAPSGTGKGVAWQATRLFVELLVAELERRGAPCRWVLADGHGSGESLVVQLWQAAPPDVPKAVLLLEEELSRVLAVAERQHATFDAYVRMLFDTDAIAAHTAKESRAARNVHAAGVWHATPDAAGRLLDPRYRDGGLANRLAPVRLVAGEDDDDRVVARVAPDPDRALALARCAADALLVGRGGEWPDALDDTWLALQRECRQRLRPFGEALQALTTRACTIVQRVARLYARLDGQPVGAAHLRAACDWLPVVADAWGYLLARYDRSPAADVVATLRAEGGALPQSALLRSHVGRELRAAGLEAVLTELARAGRVALQEVASGTGRPTRYWILRTDHGGEAEQAGAALSRWGWVPQERWLVAGGELVLVGELLVPQEDVAAVQAVVRGEARVCCGELVEQEAACPHCDGQSAGPASMPRGNNQNAGEGRAPAATSCVCCGTETTAPLCPRCIETAPRGRCARCRERLASERLRGLCPGCAGTPRLL
jgi:hypothetical protein